MMTHCDMCGTKIENGKCGCGTWFSEEEMPKKDVRKPNICT
jgi:hypothetical protein